MYIYIYIYMCVCVCIQFKLQHVIKKIKPILIVMNIICKLPTKQTLMQFTTSHIWPFLFFSYPSIKFNKNIWNNLQFGLGLLRGDHPNQDLFYICFLKKKKSCIHQLQIYLFFKNNQPREAMTKSSSKPTLGLMKNDIILKHQVDTIF